MPTPTTQLLLVPKRAIKPANESSVVWKFEEDRSVIRGSAKAKQAIEAYDLAVEEGNADQIYADKEEEKGGAARKQFPEPSDWDAGKLKVVKDVRMVTAYWDDPEYWVCQVTSADLAAGDAVVTTPLPGIKADGTDAIRVAKEAAVPAEELAGNEQEADPS